VIFITGVLSLRAVGKGKIVGRARMLPISSYNFWKGFLLEEENFSKLRSKIVVAIKL